MRSIHSFVLALTLGYLGLAFTTSPSSAMIDTGDKASCCAKAACCVEGAACCVEGAACCAKKGDAATCAMKMEKGIDPNVDFFSASTYYALGIRALNFSASVPSAKADGNE